MRPSSKHAPRSVQFETLAEYYDLLLHGKDYRSEAARLRALARRFSRSGGDRWLDVACGTGRHLEFLTHDYSVVGLDASARMLRVARRRLRHIRLVRGDMRAFRLSESFDVVSCLFSAIGHLRSERDLRRTFSNFARHLKPGGVAIVEPWIDPSEFRRTMISLMTGERTDAVIVRLAFSRRRGNHSVIRVHYLVGEKGRGIRHFVETDIGLLVARPQLFEIMRASGLEPRFLSKGLRPGRGLLIGQRPMEAAEFAA